MPKDKTLVTLVFCIIIKLCGLPVYADASFTLGFTNITANSVANAAIGEAQLFVTVSEGTGVNAGKVVFKFFNTGPALSSITDIYFDDGALLGLASINNGPGVNFSAGANPSNLPGGNAIGFQNTVGFDSDSNPPTQPNGVNPGEWVEIIFDLQPGKTFADVGADLNSGALQIGIHVQGFESGPDDSESFVTKVPEPATLLLLGAGLLGLVGFGRRRR